MSRSLHKPDIDDNYMKRESASMFAIVLVLLSGIPLITDPGATNNANAKYADIQTQAKANDCDDSSNCAINSHQTQGDSSASSPTSLQISGSGSSSGILDPSSSLDIIEIDRLVCDIQDPPTSWISCTGFLGGTQLPIEELICRTGGAQPLLPPFICLITISPSILGFGIY